MGLPFKPTLNSVSLLLQHHPKLEDFFVPFSWMPVSGLGVEVGG